MNSFFKFVLGFTTFISVSLGLTYAVTTLAIKEEQEKQVASAFQTMIGGEADSPWWQIWK